MTGDKTDHAETKLPESTFIESGHERAKLAESFTDAAKEAEASALALAARARGMEDLNRFLIRAVAAHSFYGTEAALAAGASPAYQDEDGMTALHHASAKNSRKCLRLLLKSGLCNHLLKDNDGRYASNLAIEWGNDHAVSRLLYLKRVKQAAGEGVSTMSSLPKRNDAPSL